MDQVVAVALDTFGDTAVIDFKDMQSISIGVVFTGDDFDNYCALVAGSEIGNLFDAAELLVDLVDQLVSRQVDFSQEFDGVEAYFHTVSFLAIIWSHF